MSVMKWEVRAGTYYDSLVLMQLQRALAGLEGVVDAGVVMATTANRELLVAGDLWPEGLVASADDLLIVVKGMDEAVAQAALAQVDGLLRQKRSQVTSEYRPRSLATAVHSRPDTQWVLVSVPGRYATNVAREALALGKHVFLYSDNVPLADEVLLKQMAREKGLLVMGPDCGTAVINGIGLGFANRVRRGRIGVVAASGTGLQAVTSEVHNLGHGISQAIGTGGRDLKAEVGAITAQQALALLARDPMTKVIVLVSKPPSPQVAARLLQAAQATGKDVVVNFLGYPAPGRRLGDIHFAASLTEAAETAVHIASNVGTSFFGIEEERTFHPGFIRGLFSGGTLAYEALLGLSAVVAPIYSNIPLRPEQKLPDVMQSQGHTILDLGEDVFTQGRLHPMMDNDLRLRRLRQETADPQVGFLLLDVMLGEGAHPDPASEIAPAIAEAKARRGDSLKVAVIVVGTEQDPQNLDHQIEQLMAAGALVLANTNEAVDYVFHRLPYEARMLVVPEEGLGHGLTAVNVGLESFYNSLKEQGAEAIQVDWRPPAGGNEKLMGILAKMKEHK